MPCQEPEPVKILLKQVYLSHVSKVKGLENEIDDLKKKLFDREKKLQEFKGECKKCIQLENAFKSCQAALHEQSKLFENLGNKLSVLNHTESEPNKDEIITSKNKFDVQNSSSNSNKSRSQSHNLLKNFVQLNSEKYQDSLDLYTQEMKSNINEDFSSLDQDSMILAPNTIDVIPEINLKNFVSEPDFIKLKEKNPVCSITKISEEVDKKEPLQTEKPQDEKTTLTSKRSLSRSPETNNKRLCKLNENNHEIKPCDIVGTHNSFRIKNLNDSIDLTKLHSKQNDLNKKELLNMPSISTDNSVACKNIAKDCNIKSTTSLDNREIKNKENPSLISPSLLPLSSKENKQNHVISNNEDVDDFQASNSRKKQDQCDENWIKCDKKKIKKNMANTKPVKLTSKFKFSLEALPPNYKKTNLKQTKLSKSSFQPKLKLPEHEEEGNKDSFDSNINLSVPEVEEIDIVSPMSSKTNSVDFDATCIPENYQYEVVSSGNSTPRQSTDKETLKSNVERGILFISDISDDSCGDVENLPLAECRRIKTTHSKLSEDKKDKAKTTLQEMDLSANLNSFDRLPKKEEPNYKYKGETVRKKSDRKQLEAYECNECEKYFSELGLCDKEKSERLKKCSRHRSKFVPPPTPEHFWELEFPDTQECKARGYLNETQKVQFKSLRRRPL